eukprot:CAMPEP_0117581180 /NCGR_PEP_ID=MMETSP0784-20121206/65658_1 /TAXON_ID=39447 /ORGANISM="" /LENGTH=397 /DNA_ID=CAMNT_0005381411 /DNA_START=455 /DNA_END=1648 /DNA_ORIENTATION=-
MALVPPALIIFLVSSDICSASAVGGVDALAQQWPLFLLRFVLTTAYCSAACCKIMKCFTDGADWTSGSTLQAVLFEAIMGLSLPTEGAHFTFSTPTPYSRALQRWLFTKPRILGCMTLYGVGIELVAPLVLLFPSLCVPFAVSGLGLHYGIAYLQNIDFLPWWGPFYAVFFVGDASLASQVPAVAIAYSQFYPVGFTLGVLYLAVHIAGMVIHRFIPDIDMLPLSRFPMFDSPKNLWDPARCHWAWLTDKKHASGQLMTYAFPMARLQHVLPFEIDLLPFKYLLFGRKSPDDAQLTVHTNVAITADLQLTLQRFSEEWAKGADKYTDPETTSGMLALVDMAHEAFAKAPRRSQGIDAVHKLGDWGIVYPYVTQPLFAGPESMQQPLLAAIRERAMGA